jgi:hypothetical protein
MALDGSGNIYVLGVSQNINSNTGYVTIKYAPNGNQIWAARYDSTNDPSATPTGFAVDSSNSVVVTGNAVTLKYDASGNLLWTAPYNAQAVAVDAGQNVYITGVSNSFTTMTLNPLGSNLWTTTLTNFGLPTLSQALAVDSSTNVYVAGQETVSEHPYHLASGNILKYDLNGNELWENSPEQGDAFAIIQVAGLALDSLGAVHLEANYLGGTYEPFLTLEYDSGGSQSWSATNPTEDDASLAYGLALDSSGNTLVTGGNAYFSPFYCYGTYKLDTNGNFLWTNLYPSAVTGNSVATSVAVDPNDNVYVTGYSVSLGTNGNSDIVTLKYDSQGDQLWVQRYDGPGPGNDAGNAIAADNVGNVYVAGYEAETNGSTSLVLIKYSPVIISPVITLSLQSNGNVIVQTYGSPGESFDVQASTNLQTWEDLGDVIADTNGLVQFADTNAPSFACRFYYTVPQ